MKKSFSARRVVRKIGQDDEDESSNSPGASGAETSTEQPKVKSSKPKKKSGLRLSFGPGEANHNASTEDDADSGVFTPKKSNLSRIAIARNAERKTLRPAISSEDLAFRAGASEDRPSYSKDYLAELKQSTPSTPKDLSSVPASEDEKDLDIVSKFGPLAKLGANKFSSIPTATEIKERKERRARLAKEQEYMSLHPSDSEEERRELFLRPKEKYPETRLVREDEDVLEGFDDFVEDGKIALGRKAEREEKRRKRAEMADMIAEAEGAGSASASEDDSELERNEAYEAAQTRAGTYAQHHTGEETIKRPKTPPRITPVPELGAVLQRLKASLIGMEQDKASKVRKLDELRAEKKDIAEREVWIQAQLKETGEMYEKLRIEAEAAGGGVGANGTAERPVERGLESLGGESDGG